jgi:hypothetical protein
MVMFMPQPFELAFRFRPRLVVLMLAEPLLVLLAFSCRARPGSLWGAVSALLS